MRVSVMNNSDTAWKEVLDIFLKDFVEYCLPQLSKLINWGRQWISLDKELSAITKGADQGKRLVDKLFRVYLKDGREQWVLIHCEVQSTQEEQFAKRMFCYSYRIFDKYNVPVVSCAILSDTNKHWRPYYYEVGLAGSFLRSEFLIVKIIDYKEKKADLENTSNPFASVILSQLAALEVKSKSKEQRKEAKFELTRRLYSKGLDKAQIRSIYYFIDWLIGLPASHELKYLQEIYEFEEAVKMPFVSSIERLSKKLARKIIEKKLQEGIDVGREEGIVVGREEGIVVGREEGIVVGREEGIVVGREEGIVVGREEGKEAGREEAIEEMAIRMLDSGLSLLDISKLTKLSLTKIKRLQQKRKKKTH